MRTNKRADPFYLSPAWKALRSLVLRRDGHRCTVCRKPVKGLGEARVDHIVPRLKDPTRALDPRNLRTLCTSCDAKRHAEKGGINRPGTGPDGLPLDPQHEWNRKPRS